MPESFLGNAEKVYFMLHLVLMDGEMGIVYDLFFRWV